MTPVRIMVGAIAALGFGVAAAHAEPSGGALILAANAPRARPRTTTLALRATQPRPEGSIIRFIP